MPRSTPATTAAGLSESLAVGGPPGPELQWGGPSLVQPMAWSQGLCGDCITGFGYQCSPCCCGTPAAVRKVNRHLAKYGLHPTSNMLCPCCEGCRPRRTNEFGKDDESIMGEVASGSWTCYFFCPPCYIQSNRALFVKQHMLPGGGVEDLAIGCCCWGHGLRQMEAYAAMDAELDVEKVRMAREAERLTAEWRAETQGARGALGAIANRILRV